MLAQDRPSAAEQLEKQMDRTGQHHPGAQILTAFLKQRPGDPLPDNLIAVPDALRAQLYRAEVLDATGRVTAGLEAWRAAAARTHATPVLTSAAAYALSQAALNRALMQNCSSALALGHEAAALPMDSASTFAVGIADGLCGDRSGLRKSIAALQANYPQSFPVNKYFLAELNAVDQLKSGDAAQALDTLQNAKQSDLLSLTAYLRGLAHIAAGQSPIAIADFQILLLNRGATTLTCAPVFPMAELGLARAYAASGDLRQQRRRLQKIPRHVAARRRRQRPPR